MSDDKSASDLTLINEETDPVGDLPATTSVTDDGRVVIDLNSKLARKLTSVTRLPDPKHKPDHPPSASSETVWQTSLNIVIQIVGSRGDVQPFIALGQELQRHGHKVRIATHGVFRDFVRASKLGFYSIGGDPADLIAYMVKNPGLLPEMKTLREGEIKRKRQMVREMLHGCWESCIQPDSETGEPFVANAIIANPPGFAHIHCAQALGVPLHIMFTMPWSPTQAFPHPLAHVRASSVGAGVANYLSYGLVQTLTFQGLADIINDFRKSLDLEAIPYTEGPFLMETLEVPYTYCWSPSLVPKPDDWPEYIDVCGFFYRDPPTYDPPTALHEFITAAEAPVYIGFGSIVIDDPDALTEKIVDAVQICGARAIVSAGWSKLGKNYRKPCEDIFFLDEDCPHEWLFSKVKAVVHHGGAGTTACGLRNGRPTLVVPFFGDQYFWGDMVAVAGAGPRPIHHRELNSENLSRAIRTCLAPESAVKAAAIAEGMRHENGVQAAVASFYRHLPSEKLKCAIDAALPAVCKYKKSGKSIKLSARVAESLINQSKIRSKDLESYSPCEIHITTRRWELTTAIASTLTSTSLDILNASNSIWKGPRDQLRRKKAAAAAAAVTSSTSPPTNDLETPEPTSLSAKEVATLLGSSAMSIPRIYGAIAKGFLLDLPLAVTEGLNATPRLFGEEVKQHETVTDWKSGGIVAGKNLIGNTVHSVTGLVTSPARGLEREGAVGLGKGVISGLVGLAVRPASAAMGLIAYPAQGIAKSIHSAVHSKTRKAIVEARRAENRYLIERDSSGEEREREWARKFDWLVSA